MHYMPPIIGHSHSAAAVTHAHIHLNQHELNSAVAKGGPWQRGPSISQEKYGTLLVLSSSTF